MVRALGKSFLWQIGFEPSHVVGTAVLFVLLAGVTPAVSQSCSPCGSGSQPDAVAADGSWLFRKDVQEVNILFTASHKGKFVDDLNRRDITVQDDKKEPAAVLDFHTQRDLPLRIGLVVDTSDSIQTRFKFEQSAAATFLGQVVQQNRDLGFVLGFSEKPKLAQEFSDDPSVLSHGVMKLPHGGGTALYDAVITAARKLTARPEQQLTARILVVLSDGEDNSSHITLEDAIHVAQQSELTVYAISTNPGDFRLEGDENLKKLSEETGGRALFPNNTKGVAKAFSGIADELRSRYAISYRPADFRPDGHYRHIKIIARRLGKKLKVHARKGYYAITANSFLPQESAPGQFSLK
jgi:Ca-activated chloride channel family protein